ncbi:MarR family winged helix-turn-helix transcriptional regulator [Naasia aerilata]|uniref:Ranscriptional regulator n=1 Tax=Naasia aerilata TaxID=1162966 RepID=A0ABM8GAC6_9MICO|nr:MarR family transcriptional regulator [Naasia aerilata]BDZ45165.1 ranscriptional regulator [Naasia aerilata]
MQDDLPADELPLLGEIGFLAVRTGATAMRLARERLKPLGLHVRSYSVLALSATDTGRTQREVAEYLDLDPSQVVSLVDELERAGLVTREVAPGDRRSKLVRATPEGFAVLPAAREATASAEAEVLAALLPAERETLLRMLQKVTVPQARS